MRDRQLCIDCGKQSPETETNYTLISAQFGWRLTRRKAENGEFVVEWRCPDCWRKHKVKLQQQEDFPSSSRQAAANAASSASMPRAVVVPARLSSRPPPPNSKPSKPPSAAPGGPRKRS